MTKLLIFCFIFFLFGCASSKDPENYLSNAKIRLIPVSSEKEARMMMDNHVKFLKFLFEQSRDPYYGQLKWSEACLKENVIGEVSEENQFIYSKSNIFLDHSFMPGVCSGEKFHFVLIFCRGTKFLKEIKVPVTQTTLKPENLCD